MKKIIAFGFALAPFIASAQAALGGTSNVNQLIDFITGALKIAAPLVLGAAVVFFLWGVFQFVMAAGEEEAREVGRNHMIYGIIGVAVMVSLWGLVNFFTTSASLSTTAGVAPVTGL